MSTQGALLTDKPVLSLNVVTSYFIVSQDHLQILLLTLREKCPNKEYFLVRIFLYSHCIQILKEISVFSPNTGKYGPEKTPQLDTFHAV